MRIEQAIFTSAQTATRQGYHVVAASPGVTAEHARQLATWGPTHDSLCVPARDRFSTNFYTLPDGTCCMGRTWPAGDEYSGRGGRRIYTQTLLVDADQFVQAANNPFALLYAVEFAGKLELLDPLPGDLHTLEVDVHAPTLDRRGVHDLLELTTEAHLTNLIHHLASHPRTVIRTELPRETLMVGLLNLLPPPCRCVYTFTTGLRWSPQRPFRIAVVDDPSEVRRLQRRGEAAVFDFDAPPPAPCGGLAPTAQRAQRVLQQMHVDDEKPTCTTAAAKLQQAHAPHRPLDKAPPPSEVDAARPQRRAASVDLSRRGLMEPLEQLDDAVYHAINGRPEALDEVRRLWTQLTPQLGPDLLEESREQYLRYVVSAWSNHAQNDPRHATAVLELLCMLFADF